MSRQDLLSSELQGFSSVLDVGCGGGHDIKTIKKLFPNVEAEGIDIKTNGRAEDIPFPSKSFDVIFTIAVLIYVKDIEKAISEMERVGRKKLLFVELHSKNILIRLALRLLGYYARDYGKLLAKQGFKNIKIIRVKNKEWSSFIWRNFGYIITTNIK